MAKRARRSSGFQDRKTQKKSNTNLFLVIGVAVLTVGLLAFGTSQVLGLGQSHDTTTTTTAAQSAIQVDGDALETTSIEQGRAQGVIVEESPVTDRETRYLGAPSDPASLELAEVGDLGQPALIWFHADWCHICQRVKPEVVDLGEVYDGKVKIVRLNVDHGESRPAARRYGVRATPTFVLIDAEGQLRGAVPGWPGYQTFVNAFDQLLGKG